MRARVSRVYARVDETRDTQDGTEEEKAEDEWVGHDWDGVGLRYFREGQDSE